MHQPTAPIHAAHAPEQNAAGMPSHTTMIPMIIGTLEVPFTFANLNLCNFYNLKKFLSIQN
jgi:hypothetical protein